MEALLTIYAVLEFQRGRITARHVWLFSLLQKKLNPSLLKTRSCCYWTILFTPLKVQLWFDCLGEITILQFMKFLDAWHVKSHQLKAYTTTVKFLSLRPWNRSHFPPKRVRKRSFAVFLLIASMTTPGLQVFRGKGKWDTGSDWVRVEERDIFTQLKASSSASHRPTLQLPRSVQPVRERRKNPSIRPSWTHIVHLSIQVFECHSLNSLSLILHLFYFLSCYGFKVHISQTILFEST